MDYIADTFNTESKEEIKPKDVVFVGVEPAETCCNEDDSFYASQTYNAIVDILDAYYVGYAQGREDLIAELMYDEMEEIIPF